MYQTDFSSNNSSNLTNNTTGNSSAGDVDHSSSLESASKEKLLETSEDDALETSQDMVQTNFQKKAWNSSKDDVHPPSLSRAGTGSSHVVRTYLISDFGFHLISWTNKGQLILLQELKEYLLELANQPDSLFGRTVTQFVACTRWGWGVIYWGLRNISMTEDWGLLRTLKNYLFFWGSDKQMICVSRESAVTEPCVVMRNMRQVMNGLKNYTGLLPS